MSSLVRPSKWKSFRKTRWYLYSIHNVISGTTAAARITTTRPQWNTIDLLVPNDKVQSKWNSLTRNESPPSIILCWIHFANQLDPVCTLADWLTASLPPVPLFKGRAGMGLEKTTSFKKKFPIRLICMSFIGNRIGFVVIFMGSAFI